MNLQNDNLKFNMQFDVPAGYFDSLASNVMANIKFEEQKHKRRKSIIWRSISAAASISLIAFLAMVLKPESGQQAVQLHNYADVVSETYASSMGYYEVMEMLDFDELPYGEEVEEEELVELVSDYYASPVNLEIYQ